MYLAIESDRKKLFKITKKRLFKKPYLTFIFKPKNNPKILQQSIKSFSAIFELVENKF